MPKMIADWCKPYFTPLTILLLGGCVGVMLGISVGVIAIPPLKISIGDGWANIVGAVIGVLGAFHVANRSFTKNLEAQEKRLKRPIQLRFEYCEKYLREIGALAEKQGKLQRALLDKAEKAAQNPVFSLRFEKQELFDESPEQQAAQSIASEFEESAMAEFKKIIKLAERTKNEMSWLREHKRDDLSPLDIEAIDELIVQIDDLISETENGEQQINRVAYNIKELDLLTYRIKDIKTAEILGPITENALAEMTRLLERQ
ncbi:hypothetical protein [Thalassospira xiamenensis]|uniref:hypothetical protein n=1 Tax=Thalassospira xiamenensis TaxID=220697 RepID=UPI001E35F428|nr:hypothetical protein [Thalassospira xiamenensis]MCD1593370.1 hypothetical protein [Thalassospira xiamenensis]